MQLQTMTGLRAVWIRPTHRHRCLSLDPMLARAFSKAMPGCNPYCVETNFSAASDVFMLTPGTCSFKLNAYQMGMDIDERRL
jgi:hypothetical protein